MSQLCTFGASPTPAPIEILCSEFQRERVVTFDQRTRRVRVSAAPGRGHDGP